MTVEYRVEGMTCEGCAKAVKRAIVAALPGAEVEVELRGGVVRVTGVDDDIRVARAVDAAGFGFGGRM